MNRSASLRGSKASSTNVRTSAGHLSKIIVTESSYNSDSSPSSSLQSQRNAFSSLGARRKRKSSKKNKKVKYTKIPMAFKFTSDHRASSPPKTFQNLDDINEFPKLPTCTYTTLPSPSNSPLSRLGLPSGLDVNNNPPRNAAVNVGTNQIASSSSESSVKAKDNDKPYPPMSDKALSAIIGRIVSWSPMVTHPTVSSYVPVQYFPPLEELPQGKQNRQPYQNWCPHTTNCCNYARLGNSHSHLINCAECGMSQLDEFRQLSNTSKYSQLLSSNAGTQYVYTTSAAYYAALGCYGKVPAYEEQNFASLNSDNPITDGIHKFLSKVNIDGVPHISSKLPLPPKLPAKPDATTSYEWALEDETFLEMEERVTDMFSLKGMYNYIKVNIKIQEILVEMSAKIETSLDLKNSHQSRLCELAAEVDKNTLKITFYNTIQENMTLKRYAHADRFERSFALYKKSHNLSMKNLALIKKLSNCRRRVTSYKHQIEMMNYQRIKLQASLNQSMGGTPIRK